MGSQVAIVTGASRGLGRAIALELSGGGCHVILAARSAAALEELAETIRGQGGSADVALMDASVADGPQKVVDRAVRKHGRIDVLVNNAGIAAQVGAEQVTDEEWDSIMTVNLAAAFRGARAVAPIFREAGRGRLINISSHFSLIGRSGFSVYSASKGGMNAMTRVLAVEWAKFGAQVNAVAPGYIATDVNAEARDNEAIMKVVLAGIPARRIGDDHEVANLVGYLALRAPDFLTGQVIAIDGGESIK